MGETHGLDMGPTIKWYETQSAELACHLPPSGFQISYLEMVRGKEFLNLQMTDLAGLLALFPQAARDRSFLTQIEGRPSLWFHRDSPTNGPKPTPERAEALSPTAIIPSYTDYSGLPNFVIHLYEIPEEACTAAVRRIIHAQGFVHEYAHTIIAPALYTQELYRLQMPNGRIGGGRECIARFAEAAERHSPISHYAAAYRNAEGNFKEDKYHTPWNEELAECITAYLLGFVFCEDADRRFRPFADRPKVRRWVEEFLTAARVA